MRWRLLALAMAVLVGYCLAAPVAAEAAAPLRLSIGKLQLAGDGVAGLISTTVVCPASASLQTLQRIIQPQTVNPQQYSGLATYTCSGRTQRLTLVADSCSVDPCPRLQPGLATEVQISVDYRQSSGDFVSANTLQVRRANAVSSANGPSEHVKLPPTGTIILNGLTVHASATITCPKALQLGVTAQLHQARPHLMAQVSMAGIATGASAACTGSPHRYPLTFQLYEGTPWVPGAAFLDITTFVTKGNQQQSSEFAYRTVVLDRGGAP